MKTWRRSIDKLNEILDMRPDLRYALETAIQKAGSPAISNLSEYIDFLQNTLTAIPREREMSPDSEQFHYIVNCSPGDLLKKDETFQQWLVMFSQDLGNYLDTTDSAKALETFTSLPEYHMEEYEPGPSGWQTFNQFFARRTKPGKRPVAEPCNDKVIVAATDSVYLGCWPIDDQAEVVVKGVTYSVMELLEGSPYRERFAGGLFTHSYLDTNDYHRFHVPVRGMIKEARIVPGRVFVEEAKRDNGELVTKDEVGFQVHQTRGLLILDSPIGYVAALPVGMGHVSSVNITAEVGSNLVKGEEFGYFAYGGSDMVMLFQREKIRFTANPGVHYKQGQEIAMAL